MKYPQRGFSRADSRPRSHESVLRDIPVPGLRLMAVLTDVNYTKAAKLGALEEAARVHNIEFSIHRVARGEDIANAS